MSRYRFIEAQRDHYPVRLLCQLMAVPASGYYAWQQFQQQAVVQIEPAWETALVKVFGVPWPTATGPTSAPTRIWSASRSGLARHGHHA